MSVYMLRLLVDFGLVVLIWIVQRIVYPGFLYCSANTLLAWHTKYTSRFSYLVIPLMLGQLSLSVYQAITLSTLYTLVDLVLVLLLWLSTFLQFVPLHIAIAKGKANTKLLNHLVQKNWIRTVLWTVVFVWSSMRYIFLDGYTVVLL